MYMYVLGPSHLFIVQGMKKWVGPRIKTKAIHVLFITWLEINSTWNSLSLNCCGRWLVHFILLMVAMTVLSYFDLINIYTLLRYIENTYMYVLYIHIYVYVYILEQ